MVMEKKRYGVVLIGCGHIGEQHIADIYYRDNVRIVGVVDYNVSAAQAFARRYSGGEVVEYDTDYHRFLARADVDIVIIASYAGTHLSILRDCLAAGKHVLCEKPMTADIKDAPEFCRLVRASPCKVLIAHILRHNQTYRRAAEMIRAGMIGDVRVIRMSQNHHIMDRERYMHLLRDCSPIVDCGVHYVDVVRWFTGLEIVGVSGNGAVIDPTIPDGAYDYGMIHMRLSNGGTATYEASWSESTASENRKEFIGTKGRIRLTLAEFRRENKEEGDLIEYYDREKGEYHTINVRCKYKDMYAQFSCLVNMIENNAPGLPSLEDALTAFRIVSECDEMIRGQLGLCAK